LLTTLVTIGLLSAQTDNDPYRKLMREYLNQPKSSFTELKVIAKRDAAQAVNASAFTRYTFGAMVVVAIDKKAINPMPGTIGTFYAREASKLLKRSELKLSPSYCYVVARLGGLRLKIGDTEVEAAKRYYDAKHDGIASFLYADTLQHHDSAKVRSTSIPFALEAQKKQPDSLANRWLVAGAYYDNAQYTNEKNIWKAAIDAYNKALSLAKTKENIQDLTHFRDKSIRRMNGEKPDPRKGGEFQKKQRAKSD
jgi:hypothetical protein